MSTSSFTGTIKNFSPKPDKDHYGIFIDNGKEEKWLNGRGSPNSSWSKGDKIKVKANMDEFIEIQEIDVISESGDSEAESNREEGSVETSSGENTGSDNYTSKDDRINKKVAFKEACETVRLATVNSRGHIDGEGGGEHQELVSKIANGYYNILKDMGDN